MTYYQVLGLSSNASEASIRRAFRCRAKLLHPDINPGAKAKQEFLLVNEAYQILKNADQRRLYDRHLANKKIGDNIYFSRRRTQGFKHYYPYNSSGASHSEHTPSRFEKILDQFLFLSMLFFGVSALVFGVLGAIEPPLDGVNPYIGVIFGLIFTGLIIFGWDLKYRIKS